MFHADLHPANLMICSDNTVGYIDYGITGCSAHTCVVTGRPHPGVLAGRLDGMYMSLRSRLRRIRR
jgi:hypothetical protein